MQRDRAVRISCRMVPQRLVAMNRMERKVWLSQMNSTRTIWWKVTCEGPAVKLILTLNFDDQYSFLSHCTLFIMKVRTIGRWWFIWKMARKFLSHLTLWTRNALTATLWTSINLMFILRMTLLHHFNSFIVNIFDYLDSRWCCNCDKSNVKWNLIREMYNGLYSNLLTFLNRT